MHSSQNRTTPTPLRREDLFTIDVEIAFMLATLFVHSERRVKHQVVSEPFHCDNATTNNNSPSYGTVKRVRFCA